MKKLLLLIVIVLLFSNCVSNTGLYGEKKHHPKNVNNNDIFRM